MYKDQLIKRLKDAGILNYGNVKLRSGEASSIYFDVKKVYGDPEVLSLLAREIYKTIEDDVSCVAGCGHGGTTLASAISVLYGIPLTLVRDKVKDHGTLEQIDGYVPQKNDKVAIVDDVLTTGDSLSHVAHAISQFEANITSAHVVVKRGEWGSDIGVKYLFTPEEFRD